MRGWGQFPVNFRHFLQAWGPCGSSADPLSYSPRADSLKSGLHSNFRATKETQVIALAGPLCQGQESQGQEAMHVGNHLEELSISKP